MKVIKVLVLTAVLFLGVNTAMAQSKLGHINVPLLISLMPEAKKADAQLETMAKGFQADFDKMYAEYTNLATKYQKKRSDLYNPIFKKAQDAIDAVAKEKGLIYVFDSSKGVIIYDGGGVDVLPDVKKKLGLQ